MSIESGTPITTDTYATLQAQGITGLSYIGLQTPQGSKSPIKLLEPKDDPPYPLIKSEPSLLTSITDQFKVVSKSIQRITSQVNKLLSDQNIEHISIIIDNTKAISNSLKQTSQKTEEIVNSVSEITSSFAKNNEKINSMIDNTTNAAKEFSKPAQDIQTSTTMLEEQTVTNINNMLIPQLSNTLNNFSTTADHFNQLIEKIDNNPTVLIRGQAQIQPGPGETQ
jgi:phospholipid/cholesterol/gamma-HCH transport system substrate-binding protein